MAVNIGDRAPDFDLPAVRGTIKTRCKLSDYLGKTNLVITFHPLDWTPT